MITHPFRCVSSPAGERRYNVNDTYHYCPCDCYSSNILPPIRHRLLLIHTRWFSFSSRYSLAHSLLTRGDIMALDAGAIATGVATGYLANKTQEKVDDITHPGKQTPQDEMVMLLREIKEVLAPPANDSVESSFSLQPYPVEYIIETDFHDRAHVCILFYTATPVRFDGIFGGSLQKSVGPGWIQIDQSGRLSTTDAQSHFVTVSYRDDALGASF